MRVFFFAIAVAATVFAARATSADEVVSYAIVNRDGTLNVRGNTIRLFGVFIPGNDAQCRTIVRPALCGMNRSAVALDFKIQGFVRCRQVERNRDGTIEAFCAVNASSFDAGEDLGGYLIDQGLGLALPYAPFEYHARERIARSNGRGVWGFQVDSFHRRR